MISFSKFKENPSFFPQFAALLFLFLLFFSSAHFAQVDTLKLAGYLDRYMEYNSPPSLILGVSNQDSIIWIGSRGYSDVENAVPATTESLFRIASVSKFITSLAVLQLVEKGKLKLDEDIRIYVPYYPKKKWVVTLRQLLNHTSGVRTYYKNEFDLTFYFNSTEDAVLYIAKDSLLSKPGTKYLYSTLAYNLIAAAIENVSGLPYKTYVTQNIFVPAGLKNTRFDEQKAIIPQRAKGYIRNEKRELLNAPLADLSIKYAGGGVLSNLEDLLKLGKAVITSKLISAKYLDTMLVASDVNPTYGLGVTVYRKDGEVINFGHSGAGTGFVSNLMFYPQRKLITAHLMNIRDRYLGDPAKDIAQMILYDSVKVFPAFRLDDTLHYIYGQSGIKETLNLIHELNRADNDFIKNNVSAISDFAKDLLALKKTSHAISVLNMLFQYNTGDQKIITELGKAYIEDKNFGLGLKYLKIAYEHSKDPELKKTIAAAEKQSLQKK